MTPAAEHLGLPFDEAIEFFRQKLRVPTARWTDLWRAAHDRGFMVAGAAKDDILADFQTAILRALEEGTGIREFRTAFDSIVQRYGWSYKGARGWRSAIILDTNLSTAYAAGHYQQMIDPDVLAARPFGRYLGSVSREKRTEHLEWANLVLPLDDPWWDTHYPPNGWG